MVTRSEKVKSIIDSVMGMYVQISLPEIGSIDIQREYLRPYSFVKVGGNNVNGRGFSKCSSPDEWSAAEGIRIAAKRAARNYIDNVDKWENLTDDE
jgi:hypothetical protein